MLSLIVAVANNNVIGKDNKLIWHISEDLKRFKAITSGHKMLMGRKTFESLPKGALPNRRNVVLSSNPATLCPGAEVFPTLEAALQSCQPEEQVYIIGGASVYKQAMPLADMLCLTEIAAEAPQVDAYFPAMDFAIWHEKSRESHLVDEKHPCSYAFVDYIRK